MIPLMHIVSYAGALFAVGIVGLMLQPNMLRMLLAVEAMLNGAAFLLVGSAIHFRHVDGYVLFLMVLAVAASEVAVGLVVLLNFDRLFQTLEVSEVKGTKE